MGSEFRRLQGKCQAENESVIWTAQCWHTNPEAVRSAYLSRGGSHVTFRSSIPSLCWRLEKRHNQVETAESD
jgi:hypothetical protein